jgi:integrase
VPDDFKVRWDRTSKRWIINYKKVDGKWTTTSIPREDVSLERATEMAERYAKEWYANYCRNAGKIRGFEAPAEPPKTTQSEYDAWLKTRSESPKIKAATVHQNRHHKPIIFAHPMSKKPLTELIPEDAREFVLYVRDRLGVKAAYTVRNMVNSYSAFLGSRLDLPANPFHHGAVRAELPSPKPTWGRDKPHVAPEDVPKLMRLAPPNVPGWRWTKSAVALLGGARDGELHGLLWRSVYEKHAIPHYKLEQQLAFRSKKGYARPEELKTETSFRVVPLHEVALERIVWWRKEGWREWVGRSPNDDDYVFPNSKGESWRPRSAQLLREDLANAGVSTRYNGHPITEHALRRTFSTLLHRAGVPTSTITEILGHSDGSTAADFYIYRYLPPHADAIRRICVDESSSADVSPPAA